jgi:Fe(3+) dicitrate transport protein
MEPHGIIVRANNRDYISKGIQTHAAMSWTTGAVIHNVDLGVRVHRDEADRFHWDDTYQMRDGKMFLAHSGVPGTESNRIESAQATAMYSQYKLQWGRFSVIPGLRFEHIHLKRTDYGKNDPERTGADMTERKNVVDVWIPGIGADYKFNKYVRLFAGIHKGFSPPGSHSGTEPEQSINYELGAGYRRNTLSGQVVLFFNDYRNLLGADLAASGGGGTGDLFNAGEVNVKGLEFQYAYDLLASASQSTVSVPISVVYTYTDAVFEKDFDSENSDWGLVREGDHLPYLARHQFTASAGFEKDPVSCYITVRMMSPMRILPGKGELPDAESTDGYAAVDLSLHWRLHTKISVFYTVLNATNTVYRVANRPAGWRPGLPRTVNAGIKAEF